MEVTQQSAVGAAMAASDIMQLGDTEKYAAAALFTLALHNTQVEVSVDGAGRTLLKIRCAWGCPSEDLLDALICVPADDKSWSGILVADEFWGYDCCAPGGLCRRVYKGLGIPDKQWPGLLAMPGLPVDQQSAKDQLLQHVMSYGRLLDPQLTTSGASKLAHDNRQEAAPKLQASVHLAPQNPKHPSIMRQGAPHTSHPTETNHQLASLSTGSTHGSALPLASSGVPGTTTTGSSSHPDDSNLLPAADSVAGAAVLAAQDTAAIAAEGLQTLVADTWDAFRSITGTLGEEGPVLKDEDEGVQANTVTTTPPAAATATRDDSNAQTAHMDTAVRASAVDNRRQQQQQQGQQQQQQKESHGENDAKDANDGMVESLAEQLVAPAASFTPHASYSHHHSHQATAAVCQLLSACLAKDWNSSWQQQQEQRQQQLQRRQAAAGADQDEQQLLLPPVERRPYVQMYDARARTAIKRLCHWLHVPWPVMRGFEQVLANQQLQLNEARTPNYKSSDKFMTALKVGAGALGGAALLAITGGLAAPAIASGVGAAIGLVPGTAAAASAVTMFGSSAVGAAAIGGTFGYVGARHVGAATAEFLGDVKEFGFWDVTESIYIDAPSKQQQQQQGAGAAHQAGKNHSKASAEAKDAWAALAGTTPPKAFANSRPADQPAGQQQLDVPPCATTETATATTDLPHKPFVPTDETDSNYGTAVAPSAAATAAAAGSGPAADADSAAASASPLNVQTHISSPELRHRKQPAKSHQQAAPSSSLVEDLLVTADNHILDASWPDNAAAAYEAPTEDITEATSGAMFPGHDSEEVSTDAAAAAAAGDAEAQLSIQGSKRRGLPPPKERTMWQWFAGSEAMDRAGLRPLLPLPLNPQRKQEAKLALTIAVNGWVAEPEDFVAPWQGLPGRDCDRFALVWESECLRELGSMLYKLARDQAVQKSGEAVLSTLALGGLVAAVSVPMAIMGFINLTLGNKWALALKRAQAAGAMLAHLLVAGCHGGRPVTLVGFSMGARLIFYALLELCNMEQRGIVENVVLLGTPVSLDEQEWSRARSVVSNRLVNAFSAKDWTLGLIYRVHSPDALLKNAAGLAPALVPGVENVNLSKHVSGHYGYLQKMDELLDMIGIHDS